MDVQQIVGTYHVIITVVVMKKDALVLCVEQDVKNIVVVIKERMVSYVSIVFQDVRVQQVVAQQQHVFAHWQDVSVIQTSVTHVVLHIHIGRNNKC